MEVILDGDYFYIGLHWFYIFDGGRRGSRWPNVLRENCLGGNFNLAAELSPTAGHTVIHPFFIRVAEMGVFIPRSRSKCNVRYV